MKEKNCINALKVNNVCSTSGLIEDNKTTYKQLLQKPFYHTYKPSHLADSLYVCMYVCVTLENAIVSAQRANV